MKGSQGTQEIQGRNLEARAEMKNMEEDCFWFSLFPYPIQDHCPQVAPPTIVSALQH